MIYQRKCRYVSKSTGRVCGSSFQTSVRTEEVCPKCRRYLHKCHSCHIIMAPEYGYLEGFGRKVGKLSICGSCGVELRNKGFLRISDSHTLLPTGEVKVHKIAGSGRV